MNASVYPGAAKTKPAETVSSLLAQITVQNEYKDIAGNVLNKLAVLSHLFEFYQFTKDMAAFRRETFPGLCLIIDDCIDELKTIV